MSDPKEQVIDFEKARQDKLTEKRRKTQRIFFKNLLGIYTVVGDPDQNRLRSVDILDMSEDGLAFAVPFNEEDPWPQDSKELPIRLYFSQESFLPIRVEIKNSHPYIENGIRYVRYGCSIDRNLSSFSAYQAFVKFMTAYAEHSMQDKGQVSFYYL